MHDEMSQLERRLEQATLRGPLPETPLDPETAALREGWTALGNLLAAADAMAPRPMPLPAMPPRAGRRPWTMLAVAALAASLLVSAVVAWKLVSENGSHPDIADAPLPANALPTAIVKTERDPGPSAPESLPDWDDPIDESIAQVRQDLIHLQQDWSLLGGASLPVSTKLEELEQELNKSTI